MIGRRLTVVLLLLVAVTVCFVTAPVLSGEHPWDSDRTGGDGAGKGSTGGTAITYDTIIVPDSTSVSGTLVSSTGGMSVWIIILTATWPGLWTL
jgi:hypothetical protein